MYICCKLFSEITYLLTLLTYFRNYFTYLPTLLYLPSFLPSFLSLFLSFFLSFFLASFLPSLPLATWLLIKKRLKIVNFSLKNKFDKNLWCHYYKAYYSGNLHIDLNGMYHLNCYYLSFYEVLNTVILYS